MGAFWDLRNVRLGYGQFLSCIKVPGFTEMPIMVKICTAFCSFSNFVGTTYAYGHPVFLEKSISLYPPIRNKYRFNRTSGVRTFQNSTETIILNAAITQKYVIVVNYYFFRPYLKQESIPNANWKY